jgi:hypothetical protein
MRKLFLLFVPFVLLAQTPKYDKPPAAVTTTEGPGYCGTGFVRIPKGKGKLGRVHVRFTYNCQSRNPAGLSHKMGWMWLMKIDDETVLDGFVKTSHESAWGMDIIGVRGHKVFYQVTTR